MPASASGGRLLRGLDRNKDQSYFLHALDAAQLAFCEFPVGGLRKPEVRAIARDRGIPVAGKARLDRYLLHRRASIRRIRRPVASGPAGAHRAARRGRHRPPRGTRTLHARPEERARHRRARRASPRRPGSSPPRTSPAMPSSWSRAPTIPRFIAWVCTGSGCTGSGVRRPPMRSTARRRCAIASRTSPAASRRSEAAPTCASRSRCAARRRDSTSFSTTARSASAGPL